MKKFRYIQLIKDFRLEMGLTVVQFCKLAKIGVGTYYKIINNKYNFDVNALLKISKLMNIEFRELLQYEVEN
ncbi:MAG: helix-turn-helix transcriptional regulator [Clostridia bacterium]|nr:helix-turn-helix transcriptional regulator [Clostridia bacterium]